MEKAAATSIGKTESPILPGKGRISDWYPVVGDSKCKFPGDGAGPRNPDVMLADGMEGDIFLSMKKKLFMMALLLILLVGVFLFLSETVGPDRESSSPGNAKVAESGKLAAPPSSEAKLKGIAVKGPQMPTESPLFISAHAWLNKQTPGISREEEEAILARTNRDPKVLLGLIWMNSDNSGDHVKELLQRFPHDAMIMESLVIARNSGFLFETELPMEKALLIAEKAAKENSDNSLMDWHAFTLCKEMNDIPGMEKWRKSALQKPFSPPVNPMDNPAKYALVAAGRSSTQVTMRLAAQAISAEIPNYLFRNSSSFILPDKAGSAASEIREYLYAAEQMRERGESTAMGTKSLIQAEFEMTLNWMEKFPNDTSLYDRPIREVVEEIRADLIVYEELTVAQTALPILMQYSSPSELEMLLDLVNTAGVSAALRKYKTETPAVWEKIIPAIVEHESNIGLMPAPSSWSSHY